MDTKDKVSRKALIDWLESERIKVRFGLLSEPDNPELLQVERNVIRKIREFVEAIPSTESEGEAYWRTMYEQERDLSKEQKDYLRKENERLRAELRDAADVIRYLILQYPSELWTEKEIRDWTNIGNDGIDAIHKSLSPTSETDCIAGKPYVTINVSPNAQPETINAIAEAAEIAFKTYCTSETAVQEKFTKTLEEKMKIVNPDAGFETD